MTWEGSAFVATPGNVPAEGVVPPWITTVFVQVASGLQGPGAPLSDETLAKLRQRYEVYAWAWFAGPHEPGGGEPEEEARWHAQEARRRGFEVFCLNIEEPGDAHGNSADPRYSYPRRYLEALDWPRDKLAITTTPFFGSSMIEWVQAGAISMPQAFSQAIPEATLTASVKHMEKWGWPIEQQRPLCQAYTTNGRRPDPAALAAEAKSLGVGCCPYVLEQVLDDLSWLETIKPTIIFPQPATPNGGSNVTTDWWTVPYEGGPMVEVKGFPRACYPPDAKAKGKTPSGDGPDIVAYKRTVCRAGRWGTWDPPKWDDSFSNGFSHGKSGNVKDSGIAGVQRQQKLDPTGWIGEKTFNVLRSIRVPEGPNEGEMAMDSEAVRLINEAFEKFKAPPPPPPSDMRDVICSTAWLGYQKNPTIHYTQDARRMQGVREKIKPPNVPSYEDCSSFSTWCYWVAGAPDPNARGYDGQGYTGTMLGPNGKRMSGSGTSGWKKGDLVFYGSAWSTDPQVTSHVAVYYGDGKVISHGSEGGPYYSPYNYRSDVLGAISYLS